MLQGRLPETMRYGHLIPKLDKMFGQKSEDRYHGLALVTTRWSDTGSPEGRSPDPQLVQDRERELREGFGWGVCEQMGAFFQRHDNTPACAQKIIRMVLKVCCGPSAISSE